MEEDKAGCRTEGGCCVQPLNSHNGAEAEAPLGTCGVQLRALVSM